MVGTGNGNGNGLVRVGRLSGSYRQQPTNISQTPFRFNNKGVLVSLKKKKKEEFWFLYKKRNFGKIIYLAGQFLLVFIFLKLKWILFLEFSPINKDEVGYRKK